eukprot:CAMPEP_0182445654 /NCGR_PEP_ID=MMETSP1172-20130603/3709_1 /TAXON_ID=708627 /ORGANISM="Timspurckia oligopyrenoides, Strain CCMP3278" /LENGTH=255 /DNA_ID=CAMNT_0024641465 /DNA_START=57 /DNA_END=824 /DNA_ORIENTATION=-
MSHTKEVVDSSTSLLNNSAESQEYFHAEPHWTGGALIKDIILGFSDGLTVPFALAAGLSSTVSSSKYIILAVLAELTAGALSMGLGGYLTGITEIQHYDAERSREFWEIDNRKDDEIQEIYDILLPYGLPRQDIDKIVRHFMKYPTKWVDFMMKFELGMEEPDRQQGFKSAFVIGISYLIGGLIPLSPYCFISDVQHAFLSSCIVTAIAMFVFGFVKGGVTGHSKWKSSIETTLVGVAAAAAAFFVAKLFDKILS